MIRASAVAVLVAVILAAIGIGAAVVSAQRQLAAEPVKHAICADEKMQERIRQIMFGALDTALSDRVEALFAVWLKDPTDQPGRARVGIERSVAAYLHGQTAVTQWKLPTC